MKFNKVLKEAGAGIATTADFWTAKSGQQLVRLNNNVYTLKDFITQSNKNQEIKQAISAIKSHKDFNGSVGDFIINLLKDKDGIIDIMIKNSGVFFDNSEINRNK